MKTAAFLLTLTLGATLCVLQAQEGTPRPGGPGGPGGQRPPGRETGPGGPGAQRGGPGGQRPMNPIIEALDINKDGVIDADEIAKASESLKKLDKNGDGKITADEFRPQRPGGQGGPGGPRGEGRGPRGEGNRPPRPTGEN